MPKKRKGNSWLDALRVKSPLFWVKFIAWFSLVGYVAWLSAIHAIANTTWQQNPDLALRFVPDHPLALSLKADIQFMESQSPASLNKVEAMAKRSLMGQPLNAVAVRLLGYVADARGDRKKARQLILLAQKISRRDFGTQLWLIEDAVARGDKKQALDHYDIAMRTTPSSHQILFPTLAGALDDPEVRNGLVPYIRRSPEWVPGFLSEAINTSGNPANVADLLIKVGRLPDRDVYKSLSNNLLSTLAVKSKFPAFQQYYASLPGSKATTLELAGLNTEAVNLRYPVAGWQLVDNPAIGGAFSSPDKAGRYSLSAFVGSGERGELMRKYLFLKPGNYRFAAHYDAAEGASDAEIRWDLQCLSANTNSSAWFTTRSVAKGKSATVQDFTLGSDCPHQMLMLQLAGGNGQLGAEFVLHSVEIMRR
jgi:tetratricopeptide (TPR) repeat protein